MQLERKFYSQEVKRRFLTLNGLFWNKTNKSNQIMNQKVEMKEEIINVFLLKHKMWIKGEIVINDYEYLFVIIW